MSRKRKNIESLECMICHEPMESKVKTTMPCGHATCYDCFKKLDDMSADTILCPMCRREVETADAETKKINTERFKSSMDFLGEGFVKCLVSDAFLPKIINYFKDVPMKDEIIDTKIAVEIYGVRGEDHHLRIKADIEFDLMPEYDTQ